MKFFAFSLTMLIGLIFTVLITSLLKSFITFVIPPLASYPIIAFVLAFAVLAGLCLLAVPVIERCAVEYPYNDSM